MKVLAGNYRKGPVWIYRSVLGRIVAVGLPIGLIKYERVPIEDIAEFRLIDRDKSTSWAAKLGWGAAMGAVLGPGGAIGGMLGAGSKDDSLAELVLLSGKKALISGATKELRSLYLATYNSAASANPKTFGPAQADELPADDKRIEIQKKPGDHIALEKPAESVEEEEAFSVLPPSRHASPVRTGALWSLLRGGTYVLLATGGAIGLPLCLHIASFVTRIDLPQSGYSVLISIAGGFLAVRWGRKNISLLRPSPPQKILERAENSLMQNGSTRSTGLATSIWSWRPSNSAKIVIALIACFLIVHNLNAEAVKSLSRSFFMEEVVPQLSGSYELTDVDVPFTAVLSNRFDVTFIVRNDSTGELAGIVHPEINGNCLWGRCAISIRRFEIMSLK